MPQNLKTGVCNSRVIHSWETWAWLTWDAGNSIQNHSSRPSLVHLYIRTESMRSLSLLKCTECTKRRDQKRNINIQRLLFWKLLKFRSTIIFKRALKNHPTFPIYIKQQLIFNWKEKKSSGKLHKYFKGSKHLSKFLSSVSRTVFFLRQLVYNTPTFPGGYQDNSASWRQSKKSEFQYLMQNAPAQQDSQYPPADLSQ